MPFSPTYDVPEDRQAYSLDAGPVGCLMLHGFLGSPVSSRPMAKYLCGRGITVHCPLLPGHGQLPDKLEGVTREDWLAEAEEGLATLRQKCDQIFIMGHSMGNVLGAHLATRDDDFLGMIMLAPATEIPDWRLRLLGPAKVVMKWFYPLWVKSLHPLVYERLHDFDPTLDLNDPAVQEQLPAMTRIPTAAIDEMRKMVESGRPLWPQLDLPVIIFQGKHDIAVDEATSEALLKRLPNDDKQLILFDEG
ncbi:MAG: alpha/beta fold hydrolase, partial [Chloroflexota bacterium]